MTQRFTRLFHLICIPAQDDDTMATIFRSIIDGFFKIFKPEIGSVGSNIVKGTIDIYNKSIETLLPTPAKSHYTFNLRDVSKVIQGILMADPRFITTQDGVIRLWIHELCRVFHDRLINQEDKTWFTGTICKHLLSIFKKDWSHEELFEKDVILFGDFSRGNLELADRFYEEIETVGKCQQSAERFLEEYNEEHSS